MSRIQMPLKKAYEELSNITNTNIPKNEKSNLSKYVIVFGDGRYWNRVDTCWNKDICSVGRNHDALYYAEDYVNLLKNIAILRGVRFGANKADEELSERYGDCTKGTIKNDCDKLYMSKVVAGGKVYDTTEGISYMDAFKAIAEEIKNIKSQDYISLNARIVDTIGQNFTSASGNKITMNFDDNKSSASFDIKIDRSSETG